LKKQISIFVDMTFGREKKVYVNDMAAVLITINNVYFCGNKLPLSYRLTFLQMKLLTILTAGPMT